MRKKKEESEDRTFKVRKENSSTSFRSRANSQSRSRHTSAVDRAVETLKGRERHTSMVDRIEAWGEGWVRLSCLFSNSSKRYDQPSLSEVEGRTRKVSKVKPKSVKDFLRGVCILGGLWGTIRETRRAENPEDLQSTNQTWKFRRLTIHPGWVHHPNDAGRAREVWQPDQDQDRCWTITAGLLMMLTLYCVLVESWKGIFIFYLLSLLYMNAQYFCAPWKLEIYMINADVPVYRRKIILLGD